MDARMLYIHALSPVHSGTGQSTDVIDLPVAREKVLAWPYLPASSIKGVLRDACDPGNGDPAARMRFELAFGPDTQRASEHAGSLIFTDAHLLCLPVRSYYGTFAWVTCPLALRRWWRDYVSSGLDVPPALDGQLAEGVAFVAVADAPLLHDNRLYLEDLGLQAGARDEVRAIATAIASAALPEAAWQGLFVERFAIVPDELFTFLTETGTDVVARIRLKKDTKTVANGALWYEEALPAESILSCPVLAAPRNGATSADFYALLTPPMERLLQIGGNASVGRGLVRLRLLEAAS